MAHLEVDLDKAVVDRRIAAAAPDAQVDDARQVGESAHLVDCLDSRKHLLTGLESLQARLVWVDVFCVWLPKVGT